MSNVVKFNPDELKLTKKDIIELMNGIENRWKKNKKSNRLIRRKKVRTNYHFTKRKTRNWQVTE